MKKRYEYTCLCCGVTEPDIKLQQDLDQAYNEYSGKDVSNKPSRFKKLTDKIEKLKEGIKNNSPETIEKMAKAFANCIKRFLWIFAILTLISSLKT